MTAVIGSLADAMQFAEVVASIVLALLAGAATLLLVCSAR